MEHGLVLNGKHRVQIWDTSSHCGTGIARRLLANASYTGDGIREVTLGEFNEAIQR